MNITELARRLRVNPVELLEKLPALGFDIGRKAIKVDDRLADRIVRRWQEEAWRQKQFADERAKMERKKAVQSGEVSPDRQISVPSSINVRDFADKLKLPVTDVIRELMKNGILASLNERIDFDTAAVIAEDLGFKAMKESAEQKEETVSGALEQLKATVLNETEESLKPRPPVVVVMGHVDHGKTTLLDAVRKSAIAAKESGGITQHIGAYQAEKKGRQITFIDTPGHEAFTLMRSRGARVADVAVLVVAADDGVQPQTVEVIKIIEAAKLPFVVAINKIDKSDADPDKVKRQLSDYNIIPEEWGGKAVTVALSAKSGKGLDELLDTILLVADLDKDKIRANPDRLAMGTVIEAHVDKGAGPVATVLIQSGTLNPGDHLAVGGALYGRVRAMKDFLGKSVKAAPPGMPVMILGFKVAPTVGDVMEAPADVNALEVRKVVKRGLGSSKSTASSVQSEESSIAEKTMVNVVIRADVLGSLEAIQGMFERLVHPAVGVKIVAKGLGNITDADVLSAEANKALLMGFHVNPTPSAASLARDKGVDARTYKVIYDLVDEVKAEMKKQLKPEITITELGKLEVKGIFRTGRDYQVVGGVVIDGQVKKGERARVMRPPAGGQGGMEPVCDGKVAELQSQKSAVPIAYGGQECGIKFEGKPFIQLGDIMEIYHEERKEAQLGF